MCAQKCCRDTVSWTVKGLWISGTRTSQTVSLWQVPFWETSKQHNCFLKSLHFCQSIWRHHYIKWPHKPCCFWPHMKSQLSVRGNGISSASRPIRQIRAVCPTQKVNHHGWRLSYSAHLEKSLVKAAWKQRFYLQWLICALIWPLKHQTQNLTVSHESKHHYLFGTLCYSSACDTLY